MSVLFVSGIDTDIGKTIATGEIAKALYNKGCKVITQKLVQTGCENIGQKDKEIVVAEDIVTHRNLMGRALQPEDIDQTTCPYLFSKPASPHLASVLDKIELQPHKITAATRSLLSHYEMVLLEGAGGLLVPLTDTCLTLDYIAEHGYPIVLVTSGRLGSINHTLLSIEAILARSLTLFAVLYNHWQPESYLISNYEKDMQIIESTKGYLKQYLSKNCPDTYWVEMYEKYDQEDLSSKNKSKNNDINNNMDKSMSSLNNFADFIIENIKCR